MYSEWIFDYVLQILESGKHHTILISSLLVSWRPHDFWPDYFDAVIMDFVDENCIVFDSEEENKFVYTDLHNQFKEHVRYVTAPGDWYPVL